MPNPEDASSDYPVENLPAREWVPGVYGGVVTRPPKLNKRFRPLHPLERRELDYRRKGPESV
jgi:hypothetical protein